MGVRLSDRFAVELRHLVGPDDHGIRPTPGNLRGLGFGQTQREGKQLICSVDPEGLAQLREALTVKA